MFDLYSHVCMFACVLSGYSCCLRVHDERRAERIHSDGEDLPPLPAEHSGDERKAANGSFLGRLDRYFIRFCPCLLMVRWVMLAVSSGCMCL
jgi:hypothetical protein